MSLFALRRKGSKDPSPPNSGGKHATAKSLDRPSSPMNPKEHDKSPAGRGIIFKLVIASGILAMLSWIYTHSDRDDRSRDTYVICSSSGRKIYTVDNENSNAQCMIVHDEHILDTGDLGVSYSLTDSFSQTNHHPDDLQKRWLDAEYDEISMESGSWDELDVKFLPASSIIVPGMTGRQAHDY